ncbi:MAG TPA: MarR family transcriptional regulator [Frateuria sp.]|uniref:MarR family winged helix-turn-helix transcriptional regulator n=1 Tax=Frateuria sp. TaxID=2211372 RepID=UPI002D7F956D|nr:MarR family transcriptional regulator [Frateuria sp.]HET6805605.1 MarR family transcriptional regulator [Frateuria sp.]
MARLGDCITMMDEGIGRVGQILPDMPEAEARLTRLLLMVGRSFDETIEQALKPNSINHSDFLTLMILYSRPDGSSTPGELCEYTSQGATNMTRIANALVKRGLITRGASEEDRRRVVIRITPSGRRFVQKLLPPLFPRVSAAFTGFSDAEKRSFSRLLRKLADNLDHLDEASPKDAP